MRESFNYRLHILWTLDPSLVSENWDLQILHYLTSEILTIALYFQLLGYFFLNVNETESHSSSLSKFLKQLLFVFNGAVKKKKKKKREKKTVHSWNITKDQQKRGKCSISERILGKGFSKVLCQDTATKEERKNCPWDIGKYKYKWK